jgi:hypothetical protein
MSPGGSYETHPHFAFDSVHVFRVRGMEPADNLHRPYPLSLVVVVAMTTPSSATGNIVKADLLGAWQMTIVGQTGCGFGTTLYTFTLNASGSSSNVTGTYHTAGCGDGTSSGNMFTIQSLNADGSGTANLTCGTGCGWNLNIQVSPDRSKFNVIDVSPANPGNFIEGVAIHQY